MTDLQLATLPKRVDNDDDDNLLNMEHQKLGTTKRPLPLVTSADHHDRLKRKREDDDGERGGEEKSLLPVPGYGALDSLSDGNLPAAEKHGDPEIVAKYRKQVKESEGFDIVDFPGVCLELCCGDIIPMTYFNEEDLVVLSHLAKLAISEYNREKGEAYEFHSVEKANQGDGGEGTEFYITFKVKNLKAACCGDNDGDGDMPPLETFQALVWHDDLFGTEDDEVYFCRPKPKNS